MNKLIIKIVLVERLELGMQQWVIIRRVPKPLPKFQNPPYPI